MTQVKKNKCRAATIDIDVDVNVNVDAGYGCLPPPPSPIQRILIAHSSLYESCMDGKQLGEDASIEEINEEILYFHRDSSTTTAEDDEEWNHLTSGADADANTGSDAGSDWDCDHTGSSSSSSSSSSRLMEEAVGFLGLCKALYTLPAALKTSRQNDDDNDDRNNGGHNEDDNDTNDGKIEVDVDVDIDIDVDEEDKATSVYFGNSLLVFVPLESSSSTPGLGTGIGIVAMVQVSRLYQNGTKIKSDTTITRPTGSGNYLAISASIERTHRLFCVLRGGGIDRRLKANETEAETTTTAATTTATTTTTPSTIWEHNNCPYRGMNKLFGLLRDIRKNKNKLLRFRLAGVGVGVGDSHHSNNLDREQAKELNRDTTELRKKVGALRKSLPIQSLRRDLESHYDEYLGHFLEVCIRNGGAGRCLVEMIPPPIAQDSGSHTFQSLPCPIEPGLSFKSLEQSILQILQNHSRESLNENKSESEPSLLGIAIFKSGQLLYSLSNSEQHDLSNDTAILLMEYMASYRTKMSHAALSAVNKNLASSSSSSVPELQPGLLERLTLHLGPMVADEPPVVRKAVLGEWEDTPVSNNPIVGEDMHGRGRSRGRFVLTPPSFMLGASDQTYSLDYYGNSAQGVWAPRVYLPLANSAENSSEGRQGGGGVLSGNHLSSHQHMVLFEFQEFSFLIFVDLRASPTSPTSTEAELSGTKLLLTKLEEELSEAIVHAFHNESRACPSLELESATNCTNNEPGQNIVFLDRSKQRMVLMLDPNVPSSRDSKKRTSIGNKHKKQTTRRFMGLGPKKKGSATLSPAASHRSTTLEWSAWGLDCRHLLASRLPLDVCLAFDDMINEVTRRRDAQRANASSLSSNYGNGNDYPSIIELCTCMPHGWVYAFATQEKEFYVFFDSSIYVTVADVQSAALRIKERFIVKM